MEEFVQLTSGTQSDLLTVRNKFFTISQLKNCIAPRENHKILRTEQIKVFLAVKGNLLYKEYKVYLSVFWAS